MAYAANTRTTARAAFVYERRTVKEIAKRMKVNPSTVQNWKNKALLEGDDWEKARAAASIAGEGLQATAIRFLEDFMLLQTAAIDDVKKSPKMKPQEKVEVLSRLADAHNKAVSAFKKSAPAVSELGVAIDVLRDLADFVNKKFPQHARAVLEILEPFGQQLTKKFG